ncbi:MAG: phosphatidate cytidylyltransferase [Muribaculaceae bacterium]|nr:phosphatidate cytidylyltransferase [Muribaculaceae bacterium]
MKNLLQRSLTGAVYVALIVCLIMFGGTWGFPVLCSVFAVAGVVEFFRMTDSGAGLDLTYCIDILGAILVSSLPLWYIYGGLSVCTAIVLALYIVRMVLQLYTHDHSPAGRLGASFMAMLYVAAPLAVASMLYLYYSPAIVLAMFIMIWLNDTGAFCVGSLIGRTRLFVRLSPKKSWEGFFGGMAFSVASAFVIKFCFGAYSTDLSIIQLCIMGAVISIAATWGDLAESMLKRAANIKDSGHLLPGHGGILDRIDSLLLVAPSVWLMLILSGLF